MSQHQVQRKQTELSPEELELIRILDFYSPEVTLKSLAKAIYATEEQVYTCLGNLGLLDIVSKERVAERRRIHALARKSRAALARATEEFHKNMIAR